MDQEEDVVSKVISDNTHYHKDSDKLLDIHIGNPLRRITELLEEIKKQKAFSFTLKGSLGIAGVFLALSIFGILGGGQILCDKGIQSQIGTVKILNIKETQSRSDIPVLSLIINYFAPRTTYNRTILVNDEDKTINIPYTRAINIESYKNLKVVATGNYDSCSKELKIEDQSGIESY